MNGSAVRPPDGGRTLFQRRCAFVVSLRVMWVKAGSAFLGIALATLVLAAARSAAVAADTPRWIVFSAHPEGSGRAQLFRVQADGAGLQQITKGRLPATAPAFSPNGNRIVFVRLGSGIFTVKLNGSGLRRLTSGTRDSYPTWSPDGKRIAFVRPYRGSGASTSCSPPAPSCDGFPRRRRPAALRGPRAVRQFSFPLQGISSGSTPG